MTDRTTIKFRDNASALARPGAFLNIDVAVLPVLASWKSSLYSFEWLRVDGTIKSLEELSGPEAAKRLEVERAIKKGENLEKPILGIGIFDNVEIGTGRTQFLTLAALGHAILPVHIPASNKNEFKSFLA